MAEKINKVKKTVPVKKPKATGMSVSVYSLTGASTGTLDLPKELFGVEVNQALMAQAVRIYLNNAVSHHSNTKTRSEVEGSTRKIYKQKGTGGARHGGIRAPIFVGGGIALGPKARKTNLMLPKKMKKAALKSALSAKFKDKEVFGISGLETASGKTAQLSEFFQKIAQKSVLVLTDQKNDKIFKAIANLPHIKLQLATQAHVAEILTYKTLMLTKEAVKILEERVK